MTLSDLQAWRKRVPYFIFLSCLAPWFPIAHRSPALAGPAGEALPPLLALVGAFFYVACDLRRAWWGREIEGHVGRLIRTRLLDMVPEDLNVTQSERRELANSEVFKKLTGVFWEAIDRNDVLTSHKEHFYSNGIVYSTSIDVSQICGFAGLCYVAVFLVLARVGLAYAGALLIVIALASALFAMPHARRRHMELSAEQLDLLQREEGDFVSNRFREIVLGWRERSSPP